MSEVHGEVNGTGRLLDIRNDNDIDPTVTLMAVQSDANRRFGDLEGTLVRPRVLYQVVIDVPQFQQTSKLPGTVSPHSGQMTSLIGAVVDLPHSGQFTAPV